MKEYPCYQNEPDAPILKTYRSINRKPRIRIPNNARFQKIFRPLESVGRVVTRMVLHAYRDARTFLTFLFRNRSSRTTNNQSHNNPNNYSSPNPYCLNKGSNNPECLDEPRNRTPEDQEFEMNLDPYPFQRIGVRRIERFGGRALLADEMGLGKSPQCIWWVRHYYKLDRPIIVVCPKSIKYNWAREFKRFGNIKAEIIESTDKPLVQFFRNRPKKTVYIINYDILYKWMKVLTKQKPGLIIGDEVHYAKSRKARRTKCLQNLVERAPHFIAVSGTPLTNKPAELWPVLNMLYPDEFPSFWTFVRRYCKLTLTNWGPKYEGAQNLDELHNRLKLVCMIRRKKSQVFKEMPPIRWHVVSVPLSNRAEYDLAEKDFKKWFIHSNPKRMSRKKQSEWKINFLAKYGYMRRLAGYGKIEAVKEWIDNFFQDTIGEKLIAFGVHRKVLQAYHDTYAKRSVKVDGGVTGAKRQQAFDSFTNDPKIDLFFGNIQAAGVGWNGQVASTVIFPELGDRPADHSQAAARAHRIGQTGQVNVYFLVARGTIEEKIAIKLQSKQNVLDAVLDGAVQEDSFDLIQMMKEVLYHE